MRYHVYPIRGHQLGWQAGPNQCQCIKPVGKLEVDCPSHHQMTSWSHLGFAVRMSPHRKGGSRALTNTWWSSGILVRHHTMAKTRHHNVAGTVARGGETHGLHWPQCLHLHWIGGLRVTEVQCQLPHQCHHGPIDLGAPGTHTVADTAGSQDATWKSICQSSSMKTRRTPSPIKVVVGI